MKKIVIVSYYELKEYLMYIKELFVSYHYTVTNYPLFQYAYDSNDKLQNYKTHMHNFLLSEKPDILLWWFLDVPVDVFKYIKSLHPTIYYVMANNDDPCNFNAECLEKSKIFNLIITPCISNMNKYTIVSGVKDIICMPPGYDPNYFYPENKQKECDIAMLVYDRSSSNIINNILEYSKANNKIFYLYGPEAIGELYPSVYKENPQYFNQNEIFNNTKIFIGTHALSNKYTSLNYLDMRILGSGTFLLVENMPELNKIIHGCNVLEDDYITQIDNLLKLETFENKTLYEYVRSNCTWDNWVKEIHIYIANYFFDGDLYKSNYDIPNENSWAYFIDIGVSEKHIAFKYTVPTSFMAKDYSEATNIVGDKYKLYLHWYLNGKDENYIVKKIPINVEELGFSNDQWFDLGHIFNGIYTKEKRQYLMRLGKLCNNNPRMNVSEALEMYFRTIDS